MINKLHALMALGNAAVMLRRPDVAEAVSKVVHAFTGGAMPEDDHDFRDAPRTKAWIETHNQPTCSPHADFINGLVEWACKLERELKKEG